MSARAVRIEQAEDEPAPIAVPPAVAPYVEAIGEAATVHVLLQFGGTKLYLAADPKSRSPLAALIGREKAIALAAALGPGHVQIPTGKPFIARFYKLRERWTVSEIARKLHTKDSTVRGYLKSVAGDDRQLSLL